MRHFVASMELAKSGLSVFQLVLHQIEDTLYFLRDSIYEISINKSFESVWSSTYPTRSQEVRRVCPLVATAQGS